MGKHHLFFTFLLCSYSFLGLSQKVSGSISGQVKSATGQSLPGVSLVLKNTAIGGATDENGQFYISGITAGTYTLQVSFIGFKTQEKPFSLQAGESISLQIELQEAAQEIGEVTVEGKSTTTQINQQAYAVTALSAKELYNSSQDVKQVLNTVAGVRILENGGLGSDFTFTLNGFSGQQIRFLLDGIPMDNFGPSLSINNIPVNAIERIEVYKGVVPVWLGTDALGGAVNIISGKRSNYLDASYSFSSFNTHRSSVNAAYTNAKTGFTLRANLFHNYSDNNYRVLADIRDLEKNRITGQQEVERFHDRYRSGTAKIETGVVNRKYADNLLLGFIASGNDKQVQTGSTMASVYGGITRNSHSFIPTLRYSKKDLFTKGLSLNSYAAYNITETQNIDTLSGITYNWLGDTSYTPGSTNGESARTFTTMNMQELTTQLNASYEINARHSLALNYAYGHYHRKAFDTENPENIGNKFPRILQKQVVGLAYKAELNEKWSATLFSKLFILDLESQQEEMDLNTGKRQTNKVQNYKQNVGYGLATSYFVTRDFQLKASYEHTYRLPQPLEVFGDGLFVLENPEIGPEQSDNVNVGAAYRLQFLKSHQVQLEAGLIYREAKDLIYQVVKVASPETRYDNLSQTRTLGVEGGVKYHWKFLHVGANITFQDITDHADSVYNESTTGTGYQKNYQKGFRLPNTPYLFANGHAGFSFKDVWAKESQLNFNYNFYFSENYFLSWAEYGIRDGKKVIPRQMSHDLEVSYSLKKGKYNIALECRNLTDAALYDKFYLQKPGRAFYIKLRYAIGR